MLYPRMWFAVSVLAIGTTTATSNAVAQTDPSNFSTVLNAPGDIVQGSIGSNTQLNVFAGGSVLRNSTFVSFQAGESDHSGENVEVNIFGGRVTEGFRANSGTTVNFFDGFVGDLTLRRRPVEDFHVNRGSVVNIYGGQFDTSVRAFNNGLLNITGGKFDGRIDKSLDAHTGSVLAISGGDFALGSFFEQGSTARVSGGAFGRFRPLSGSDVTLVGGEFRLNGAPIAGLESIGSQANIQLGEEDWLSGTLSDGTPFAISAIDGDFFPSARLTLESSDLPQVAANDFVLSQDLSAPIGLRQEESVVVDEAFEPCFCFPRRQITLPRNFNAGPGSSVVVEDGGELPANFEATNATVEVRGGVIGGISAYGSRIQLTGGEGLVGTVAESTLAITGGRYDSGFRARQGSSVSISGGELSTIGPSIEDGSTLHVSDGVIAAFTSVIGSKAVINGGDFGGFLEASQQSQVVVNGGNIGEDFVVFSGSEAIITGGDMPDRIRVQSSSLSLHGTQFAVDGEDITDSLIRGNPLVIDERSVTLSGILLDGSEFSFDLNPSDDGTAIGPVFSPDSVIAVVLAAPGDSNSDGVVNAADYVLLRDSGIGTYSVWQANFGTDDLSDPSASAASSVRSVPEPCTMSALLVLLVSMLHSIWPRQMLRPRC